MYCYTKPVEYCQCYKRGLSLSDLHCAADLLGYNDATEVIDAAYYSCGFHLYKILLNLQISALLVSANYRRLYRIIRYNASELLSLEVTKITEYKSSVKSEINSFMYGAFCCYMLWFSDRNCWSKCNHPQSRKRNTHRYLSLSSAWCRSPQIRIFQTRREAR